MTSFRDFWAKDTSREQSQMVRLVGNVPRDSEVTWRDISFKSVWRELKGEGWTRKPPPARSLDERYRYISPNGNQNGTNDIDYYLGEEAVLEYDAKVLRTRARGTAPTPSATTTALAPGDAQLAVAAQVVRDTYLADIEAVEARAATFDSADRTHNDTVSSAPVAQNDLRDAHCCNHLPRSQGPLIEPHPRLLQSYSTSPHISADDLNDCDAASSSSLFVIDDDSGDVPGTRSDSVDDDTEGQNETVSSALLADNDADELNKVEDVDISDLFGAMDSGEEAERDDVETGEYNCDDGDGEIGVPEDAHDDNEETETEIAAEVLFAESFLNSFGGEDEVLAGNLKNDVLRSMSVNGWEDVLESDIHEHLNTVRARG